MPQTANTVNTAKEVAKAGPDIFEQALGNVYVARAVKIIVAIGVVFVCMMISKVIVASIKKKILEKSDHNDEDGQSQYGSQIADLIGDIVYYTLMLFSVFIGFEILGFDIGLILGGVSFGVGLAFKEVIGNMISGVLLLTMKEIKLGDMVQIDIGGEQYFGKIEEIGIRITTIRQLNMKQVFLPNLQLIDAAIQTYSAEEFIRIETTIEVHYDTDLEFATKAIIQAINSCPFIKNPSQTMVLTENFGDSGIEMRCLFYIDPNAGWTILQLKGYVNHVIINYCRANKINIPYPHITLNAEGKLQDKLLNFAS